MLCLIIITLIHKMYIDTKQTSDKHAIMIRPYLLQKLLRFLYMAYQRATTLLIYLYNTLRQRNMQGSYPDVELYFN